MRRKKLHLNTYFRFFIGLAAITLFIAFAPSVYRLSNQYRSFEENVENKGIEVNALFYTEEEATFDAEKELEKALSAESQSIID